MKDFIASIFILLLIYLRPEVLSDFSKSKMGRIYFVLLSLCIVSYNSNLGVLFVILYFILNENIEKKTALSDTETQERSPYGNQYYEIIDEEETSSDKLDRLTVQETVRPKPANLE
jgi:hypothetical protein